MLPMGLDFTKPVSLLHLTMAGGRWSNNFPFLPTSQWPDLSHMVVLHQETCCSVLPLAQNLTHCVKTGESFPILLENSSGGSHRILQDFNFLFFKRVSFVLTFFSS